MSEETPVPDEEIKRAVIDRAREVRIADGDPGCTYCGGRNRSRCTERGRL